MKQSKLETFLSNWGSLIRIISNSLIILYIVYNLFLPDNIIKAIEGVISEAALINTYIGIIGGTILGYFVSFNAGKKGALVIKKQIDSLKKEIINQTLEMRTMHKEFANLIDNKFGEFEEMININNRVLHEDNNKTSYVLSDRVSVIPPEPSTMARIVELTNIDKT